MDKPVRITVPLCIDIGQAIYVEWGAVDEAAYQLERSVDGGAFSLVYSGPEDCYTDVSVNGWNEVRYRACAVSGGLKSSYTYSINVACVYFRIDEGLLLPFRFLVNFKDSKFDVVPNIDETTEELEGQDGEFPQATRYESRLFNLVCRTPASKNLEVWQIDNLISAVGRGFHAIKDKTRYFMYRDKLYKVRSGKKPEFNLYPSWFSAQLAFKALDCYGYGTEQEVRGTATLLNSGEVPALPLFYFEGAINQPALTINGVSYLLKTSSGANDVIVVDCAKHTAVKNGVNLLGAWESDFPELKMGENTVSLPENCRMVWKERFAVV